jgi:multidrug efflux pump
VRQSYQRKLTGVLKYRPVTSVFAIIILTSCYFLASTAQSELAPSEDQSMLWAVYNGPNYANLDYMTKFSAPINQIFSSIPEAQDYFMVNGMMGVSSGISGVILKPWSERKKSEEDIKNEIQPQLSTLAGVQSVVFEPPSLPGNNGGLPVQFVITSTENFPVLYEAQEKLKAAAQQSGLFAYVDATLLFNNPQIDLKIDRNRAADVGVSMEDIADLMGHRTDRITVHYSVAEIGCLHQAVNKICCENKDSPTLLLLRNASSRKSPAREKADRLGGGVSD